MPWDSMWKERRSLTSLELRESSFSASSIPPIEADQVLLMPQSNECMGRSRVRYLFVVSRYIAHWYIDADSFGPIVTVWFKVLQKNVNFGSKAATTVARVSLATSCCPFRNLIIPPSPLQVGLDQLVAAPIIISTFFTVMTMMEGKSLQDAKTKIDSST